MFAALEIALHLLSPIGLRHPLLREPATQRKFNTRAISDTRAFIQFHTDMVALLGIVVLDDELAVFP